MASREDKTGGSGPPHIVNLSGLESAWPSLVESLANGVLLLDRNGKILYTNREAQRLLQRRARELHGQPFGYPLRHGEPVEFDLITPDGTSRVIEMRAVPVGFSDGEGWVASLHDVTERARRRDKLREQNQQLKEKNAELYRAAQYDPLTGLLNRRGLNLVMHEHFLTALKREGRFTAVVIDLDNFKQVNDDFGHDIGDRMLVMAAERLRSSLREGDHLARIGGDEFIVLLADAGTSVAAALADKLRLCLASTTDGDEMSMSASLAVIEVSDAAGVTLERLLQATHDALRSSKRLGKNRISIAPALTADADSYHPTLEDTGTRFPDDVRLYTLAQPIADVESGGTVAFEWFTRPRSAVVTSASDFFRLAAEVGDVFATNLRCLTLSIRDARTINGGNQLHHFNFAAAALLEASGSMLGALLPRDLGKGVRIEVSLTDMAGPMSALREAADRVRSAGAGLVLEHYTPGQRCIETALLLQPVAVKLAVGVLRRCATADDPVAALGRVIAPLRETGIDVIATGVESNADAALVHGAGIRHAQGFLFGKPETAGYWRARSSV